MLRSLARAVATNHRCHATFSSLSHSSRPPKPTPPFKPDPKKSAPNAAAAAALIDEQERRRQLDADDKNPSLDVGPNGRPLFSAAPSFSHLSRNDVCTYFKLTYPLYLTSFFVVAFFRTLCMCFFVLDVFSGFCDSGSAWFCRKDALNKVLPEGLPVGMVNEFQDSLRTALLVRQSFLDLRDNFRRVVDPPMWSSNGKGAVFVLFFCSPR